ncbi:4010_t:CDS:2 [Diversispora eburnea]|uniref:ESCRT-II complex subunit VPS25 n=1 Tax=Diversispora eburnea TaxID=1213867 RepID=A0A9N9BW60_9GLOM|nr:4010_t:CDS:2 [Diversispora eburnea]
MVKQEWDSPLSNRNVALIYWRKPEEWASLIDKWVFDCGLNNSIVTIYEILHGESSEGMEFHDLNQTILLKALDILVKRGAAQLLQGSSADDLGVKFFGINVVTIHLHHL